MENEQKKEGQNEEQLLQERKEKLITFIRQKYNWIAYIILAIIVWIAVKIRTLPMKINSATGKPGLWDITRDNWTLGPDLDPFLFLRWAKQIIAHGSLGAIDAMRYVPLGFNNLEEMRFLAYLIAWFHEYLGGFFSSTSIEYSAVIYPVFMFALTIIAFFLLTRKLFIDSIGEIKADIVALVSSFFLAVLPSLLPRTIAGIPEKESTAFLFIFLAFYFFICSWKSDKSFSRYLFALLAGLSTVALGLIWGGVLYIFMTIGPAALIAFLVGQLNKERLKAYSIWLLSSFIFLPFFSSRYTFTNLLTSTTTLIPSLIILLAALHFLIFKTKIKNYVYSKASVQKIPKPVVTLIVFIIIGVVCALVLFGLGFIIDKFKDLSQPLITPVTSRLGVTVAENRQPFYSEWASSFGPSLLEFFQFLLRNSITLSGKLSSLPLFFWLFFIGSVYMLFLMLKEFNFKERIILTLAYLFFLTSLVFSRYSSESTFNGTNSTSLLFYALGFIILISTFSFYYYKSHQKGEEEKLKRIDMGIIILFVLFFLSIVSARASVRTIMVLVPSASIMVAYFVVMISDDARKVREKYKKILVWALVAIILIATIFSGYYFYQVSANTAKSYIPSAYTQQWQKAMAWVRENTPQNSVFGHWWDYGYWLQSMGERATVLDGGNSIVYWDYLMGRYGLTAPNITDALNFLYSHNTTHFLIDPTDIGKYAAFSSIGSDVNYDRRSWISTFVRDDNRAQETKNSTIFFYMGGTPLDEDIAYRSDNTTKYLPTGSAALGAITVEIDNNGSLVSQPKGIFVYRGKNYLAPLRYAFINKRFIDFNSGIEGGVFLLARLIQDQQGFRIEKNSALLYLSNRTVKSQLARLYLYSEGEPYFKLVHSEDDFVVSQLKSQYNFDEDFIIYGELRGPIRIWEIHYPENMKVNQEYLNRNYPDPKLDIAK